MAAIPSIGLALSKMFQILKPNRTHTMSPNDDDDDRAERKSWSATGIGPASLREMERTLQEQQPIYYSIPFNNTAAAE